MTTISRRRTRWPLWAAVGLIAGVPALAEAQLFPNLPIKRERPCCNAEDPVFRLYRHQYYGYHPTCWRRFPPGWGCPSPEGPNSPAAMEEIRRDLERQPRDNFPPEGGFGPGEGPNSEGPEPMMPGAPENIEFPPLPDPDRSPFQLDTPDPLRPGTNPGERAPAPLPRAPQGPQSEAGPSPLDALPAGGPELEPAASNPGLDAPEFGPEVGLGELPTSPPVALLDVGHPDPGIGRGPAVDPNGGLLPFPASPDPAAPAIASVSPEVAPGPPPAVQAPQRRSLIGGFFQNLGRRRR